MNTLTNNFDAVSTEIMPIPMAVAPYLSTPEHIAVASTTIDEITAKVTAIKPEPAVKDREFFKERINLWWNKSIQGILEVGWCLVEAQASLTAEEWSKFRNNDVPFDYSVLCKLMNLAKSSRICDPKHKNKLPANWSALYEIAQMDADAFELADEAGLIRRNVTVKELITFRKKHDEGRRPKPAPAKSKVQSDIPDLKTEAADNELVQPEPVAHVASEGSDEMLVASESSTVRAGGFQAPLRVVPIRGSESEKVTVKNRIAVYLAPETVEKNRDQIAALRLALGNLIAKYPFIESIDMADAA